MKQHYVPKVYLKAWETQVESIDEPDKKFYGIYYFDKAHLDIGDGRNKKTVLRETNIYNIDYKLSFIMKSCPKIQEDFLNQVMTKIRERNVDAFYEGKRLGSSKDLARFFFQVDDWEFRYKYPPFGLAKKNAILSDIKQINSYVIEHALDDLIEKRWENVLDTFINEMEHTIPLNGIDEIRRINENVVMDIVKMVLFLVCRNPDFDYMGILPDVIDICSLALTEVLGADGAAEFLENQKKAIWLKEIYNALFSVPNGYFYTMKQTAQKNFQMILYKCWEGQGEFITSDTPAFQHISFVESVNTNSIICPLTPQYALMIMRGNSSSIRDVNFRGADNKLIRFINTLILGHCTKAVVANCKYLGYLL